MTADLLASQQAALLTRLGITLKQRDRSVLCLSILWFFAGATAMPALLWLPLLPILYP